MLKKMIKNNNCLFSLALTLKELTLKQDNSKLNDNETNLFNQLNKDGVAVIPNFFSDDECKSMRTSFDNLVDEKSVSYNNDKRIFGIEKFSNIHNELFFSNKMFKKVGEAYIGDELILQTTMAAKIDFKDGEKYGSGGEWHRDSFSKQFKAIAYLDDVSKENGPFMYIKGSHSLKNIKKVLNSLKRKNTVGSDFRYTDEEIEEVKNILNEEITYFTAPKGTLVLADIRGLHTGMPIEKGSRYSVFNYYIAKSSYQANSKIDELANNN